MLLMEGCIKQFFVNVVALHIPAIHDSLAEWSKAVAQGAIP